MRHLRCSKTEVLLPSSNRHWIERANTDTSSATQWDEMTEESQVWLGAVGLHLHVCTAYVSFKALHLIFNVFFPRGRFFWHKFLKSFLCIHKIRHQITFLSLLRKKELKKNSIPSLKWFQYKKFCKQKYLLIFLTVVWCHLLLILICARPLLMLS